MLMATGLKNQAHTLKLSRLMVRANEAPQRTALLRILRHGEFPCRRLFLDYHGLRLIHGWMNDAQQKCKIDKKQESLRYYASRIRFSDLNIFNFLFQIRVVADVSYVTYT